MKNNYKRILPLSFLCICLFFAGCTKEEATKVTLKNGTGQSENGEKKEVLKIAVSAIISPKKTFVYYKDMLDYISKKMDIPVELIQRDTYAEVNALVENKKISAAFVCSGAYIDGKRDFGMELLVAPMAYGQPFYHSYIIVPRNSKAKRLEDLKGKKFAFTDPMSNTGKLAPTYMIGKIGEKPESFFSDIIYTNSHDKSIEAVARGIVDAAAVDSLIWDYADATEPEFTSKTKVIIKSPPYGIPPVVIPAGMAPELKEKLRNILLNMHLDDEGRSILEKVKIDRFVRTEDSAYDSIREMQRFLNEKQGHNR
ncbi:MAG: phosphate/phosphite/phosphonate ABC transporter substrate-binding protein [Thermodesulfovibrionia bacterium]|nr:phosphate/phosphite/phosphonate ABC transporter substrate-binding protein [Thermodesulfovibrionia bacterium]